MVQATRPPRLVTLKKVLFFMNTPMDVSKLTVLGHVDLEHPRTPNRAGVELWGGRRSLGSRSSWEGFPLQGPGTFVLRMVQGRCSSVLFENGQSLRPFWKVLKPTYRALGNATHQQTRPFLPGVSWSWLSTEVRVPRTSTHWIGRGTLASTPGSPLFPIAG